MGFGMNNPLPSSLASECKKAGRILSSFVDPRQAFGPDKVIPPGVLQNAKGLAILTVIKAGFVASLRMGSGLVVARLADGTWSAPSAIFTTGAGFGSQIGAELTDFVFILNDPAAVRSFSQMGSITLGGNVSIAAGPLGRNAEAAGTASMKGVAGVFSYSKTKGLFAGVSLEGSVLVERRDANEKLYHSRITASQLLGGAIRPTPAADPLMRILNSRLFSGRASNVDDLYNDLPVYDDRHDDLVWEGRRGEGYQEGVRKDRTGNGSAAGDDFEYRDRPQRAATWQDSQYDRAPIGGVNRTLSTRVNPVQTFGAIGRNRSGSGFDDDYVYSDRKPKNGPAPGRPAAPKPKFVDKGVPGPNQAVALFTFDADQPGDLGFKKGDIITIVKRSESKNDWWTGKIGDREGIFPSNYVETF